MIIDRSQMALVAAQLKNLMDHCQVFTFTGPLGAGKTTLVSELLRQTGIKGPITSPTFTYVNEYENEQGKRFYHFDLYRVKSLAEFLSSGFDEYLYAPASWALIEWPEVISPLLNHAVCQVSLEYVKRC